MIQKHKYLKQLIVQSFKRAFNDDVVVVDADEDGQPAVAIMYADSLKDGYTDADVIEMCDFMLSTARDKNGQLNKVYIERVVTHPVNHETPPESELAALDGDYPSFETAMLGLLQHIVVECVGNYNFEYDCIEQEQQEQYYAEHN